MRFEKLLAVIAPLALAACGGNEAPPPPPPEDAVAPMPEPAPDAEMENPDETVVEVEPEVFGAEPMDMAAPMGGTEPMTDDFGGEEMPVSNVPEGVT